MSRPAGALLPPVLAAALGAASIFAFAPFHWFPVVWLTAGAYYLLLLQAGRRAGMFLGFAFGLGYFLAGTSWVFVSLSVFGGLPPPLAGIATFLFCAGLALFPALAAVLFVRLRSGRFAVDPALFASLWALAEWLRGWILTGFPWLALGYSQAPPSPLAGYAPVFGVYGVSLAAVLLAAVLAESVRRCRAGASVTHRLGRLLPLVPALALLAIGSGLGSIRWTEASGAPLRVALLQGNVPQDLKWRPEKLADSLTIYGELMRAHPATLTVMPETAIPTFLEALPRPYLELLLEHAAAQRGDILFGIAAGDGQRYANAAVSVGTSPTQLYAKSHLVPFGEFVPPGFQWFLDLMHIPMSNFTPGPERQPPLAIAGQKIAVNICYEDVFGNELIRSLPEATLLINLSNTAWFGDSLAQPQHLQIAQLRALETGRPMLRATNTGMTAVVAPDGTVQAALPPFSRAALVAEVRGYSGTTPYARWGNAPFVALALLLTALAVWLRCRASGTRLSAACPLRRR